MENNYLPQDTSIKGVSKYRPTSSDIIKGIKATKRTASKLNQEQKGVVNFGLLGVVFALIVLALFGTSTRWDIVVGIFSSGQLAFFMVVVSMTSWLFTRVGLLK